MPDSRDDIASRLAVERRLATPEQVAEAREVQRKAVALLGMDVDIVEVLQKRGIIDEGAAQELAAAVAVEMVTADGTAKLLDLGLARHAGNSAEATKLTQSGNSSARRTMPLPSRRPQKVTSALAATSIRSARRCITWSPDRGHSAERQPRTSSISMLTSG